MHIKLEDLTCDTLSLWMALSNRRILWNGAIAPQDSLPTIKLTHPQSLLQGTMYDCREQRFPLRGLWWTKPSHTARGFWVVESSFSITATFKDQEAIQNAGT